MSNFDRPELVSCSPVHKSRQFWLLCLCLATALLLHGQAFLGSISGIVTDGSGAVIAGAVVRVTDVDRNIVFSSVSNETGLYVVRQLTIGRYRLVVDKSGFRTYTVNDFPLAAEQRASIDVSLAVGTEGWK